MSFATDLAGETNDLLGTSVYGEVITIVRNTLSYSDTGAPTDSWASVATPNADIQPVNAVEKMIVTGEIGQQRTLSVSIFLPNATDVRVGDRIRPSGWVAGDDEYEIGYVMSD